MLRANRRCVTALGLCLLCVGVVGADPGFVADLDPDNAARLQGRWINEFLYPVDGTATSFWQVVDFGDTVISHAYFSRDPRLREDNPYTTVVSQWAVGSYTDPGEGGARWPVIRLQPTHIIDYDEERDRFRRISGDYAPQFRRFTFADDGTLNLSELVVLEIPVDRLLDFPDDAATMVFGRLAETGTAVPSRGWARLKTDVRPRR